MSAIIVIHQGGEERWEGDEVEFRLDSDGVVQITDRMPVMVTQEMVDGIKSPAARVTYQQQIGQTIHSDPVTIAVYASGYWQSIKLERDQAPK
jgi:hypothetical protein